MRKSLSSSDFKPKGYMKPTVAQQNKEVKKPRNRRKYPDFKKSKAINKPVKVNLNDSKSSSSISMQSERLSLSNRRIDTSEFEDPEKPRPLPVCTLSN